MKRLLLLLFILSPLVLFATSTPNTDTLNFDKRVTRLKDHWVIFPKDKSGKYTYGFVYLDPMAGFTFQVGGAFNIDDKNNYLIDTALQSSLATIPIKVRLQPNTKMVAELPADHFKALNIEAVPSWLRIYNSGTGTPAYQVALGRHLNNMNDCEYAINVMLETYKAQPHLKGLEFELAYAYNVLKRFDDAIPVLESGIKNNPDDIFLYKELGYSYLEKKEIDKAIEIYKTGIAACKTEINNEKAEMALNIAAGYRYSKNDSLCKEWQVKAVAWAPKGSGTYKALLQMGLVEKTQGN